MLFAVLSTAKDVKDARNRGIITHKVKRAPEILARAERELARLRTAADVCEADAKILRDKFTNFLGSERRKEDARRYRSDAAELEAAIAELRREVELSGLLEQKKGAR